MSSNIVKAHQPCPDCGSSDALSIYDDGHSHCFSCLTHKKNGVEVEDFEQPESVPKGSELLTGLNYQDLPHRKINEETCRKFGYSVTRYKGEIVEVAPYHDKDGKTVAQKVRDPQKNFTVRGSLGNAGLFGQKLWAPGGKRLVITEGECLPGSTEVLTPEGWIQLAAYQGGQVAQWEDGAVEWTVPTAKIDKPYVGELIQFRGHFVTMTTTPGHRMPGIDAKGRISIMTAEARESGRNRHHLLPRSGKMTGPGIGLSHDQLAFCLAISADASIDVRKQPYAGGPARRLAAEDRYARMTLFRPRKVGRMSGLLKRLGLDHVRTEGQRNPRRDDGVFFGVPLPDWVPGRLLPWEWIERATEDERSFLIEELRHWDGNDVGGRDQYEFATKHVELADWVQTLCHTSGRCSTVMRRSSRHGEWIKVSILNGKAHGSYQALKPERVRYHGRVYCLTVPSGMFLARENGRVFVTGNCDALSYAQATNLSWPVVSVPSGAAGSLGAFKRSVDWIDSFEEVVFLFDNDEAGREHVRKYADLLSPGKAKIGTLPLKDPNDMLKAGRIKELLQAVWQAQPYRPDGIVSGQDLWELISTDEKVETVAYPWDCWNDKTRGLRRGELVTFTAGSGIGKSSVAREIAYDLIKRGETVGLVMLEENLKRTSLGLMSLEMGKPLHLDRVGVDNDRLHDAFLATVGSGRCFLYDHFGSTDVSNLLARLRYLSRAVDCRWLVLDHLSIVVSGLGGDDERRLIDQTMTKLRTLVEETGVGLILVSHLKRPSGDKGHEEGAVTSLSQLRGSHAIAQLSDMVIGLERSQQSHESDTLTCRCLKNRYSGETGVMGKLRYDRDTGRLVEAESSVMFEHENEDF